MTTIYLPTRKAAAKLDAKEIYELAKAGKKQGEIADALKINRGTFSVRLNNQASTLDAYWQGKQEFETGICTRD